MQPDWVSNPGPLTYESGALQTALRGPAEADNKIYDCKNFKKSFITTTSY